MFKTELKNVSAITGEIYGAPMTIRDIERDAGIALMQMFENKDMHSVFTNIQGAASQKALYSIQNNTRKVYNLLKKYYGEDLV